MLEEQLERIAVALETIAARYSGEAPAPAKAPAKSSSKPSNKTTVGKQTEPDPDGPTEDDVRAALVRLQESDGNPNKGKSILKEEGASNLMQLDPAKYAAVIAKCDKAAA